MAAVLTGQRPVLSARWAAWLYQCRTGCFLGRRSGPTSQSISWSSANLMVNWAFGYVSVSSEQVDIQYPGQVRLSGSRSQFLPLTREYGRGRIHGC
jgi:hypothetical protein